MNKIIFLLTKDCMAKEALPIYGNKIFNTPNIMELAKKGTVFNKHYTTAASTSMAMSSLLTGKYPYEFKNRKIYEPVDANEFKSVFDILQENGYICHLIWDETWMDMAWKYVREFGDDNKTIIHNLDIAQPAGSHKKKDIDKKLTRNDTLLNETLDKIYKELENIDTTNPTFIWMHLPHILKGRISYMDDMEDFDKIVGFIRKMYGDENIYITTDHGHMNMHKGLVGYGFHVYEPIVSIPLITPKIDNLSEVEYMTNHLDLMDIILNNRINKRDYTIVDTAYYMQPHRKTAIIKERFKYIYNKEDNSEELYDLMYDPEENYNILKEVYYDTDRNSLVRYDELYYYPYKEEALKEYKELKKIFNSFYKRGTKKQESIIKMRKKIGNVKRKMKNH